MCLQAAERTRSEFAALGRAGDATLLHNDGAWRRYQHCGLVQDPPVTFFTPCSL